MKLAAVNPVIDFNLDSLLATEVSIIFFSSLLGSNLKYMGYGSSHVPDRSCSNNVSIIFLK